MLSKWIETDQVDHDALLTYFATLVLLVAVFLPRISTFPPYFLTFDELTINTWTNEMVTGLFTGQWQDTANNAYPAVTSMWLTAAKITVKGTYESIVEKATFQPLADLGTSPLLEIKARRLIFAVVNSLVVLAMYGVLKRLFGQWPAFLATFLIAVDPFFLTQSRVGRVEALSTGLMLLSILVLLLAIRQRSYLWLVGSGILIGLAALTKITTLVVVPFGGLVLVMWPFLSNSQPVRGLIWRAGREFVLWILVIASTGFVLWPALWVAPRSTLKQIYTYLQQTATGVELTWGLGVFFRGELIQTGDPGWLFYPFVVAFRTTPLVWIGLLMAFLWGSKKSRGWWRAVWNRRLSERTLAALAIGCFTVIFFTGVSLGASKVDRYLLPVFPLLATLAGLGLSCAIGHWIVGPRKKIWQGLALGGVVVAQLAVVVPHHPYYFTYWNPLIGGSTVALETLPAGAGEGLDGAMTYLSGQASASNATLLCSGVLFPLCKGLFGGEVLGDKAYRDAETPWGTADYVLLYIFSLQRQAYPTYLLEYLSKQDPVYTYQQGGATYAQLYQLPYKQNSLNRLIGQSGKLFGYQLSPRQLVAGETLEMKILWQNLAEFEPFKLVVALVDKNGYLWTESVAEPLPKYVSVVDEPEAIVERSAVLQLPRSMPPGDYQLKVLTEPVTQKKAFDLTLIEPIGTVQVRRGAMNVRIDELPMMRTLTEDPNSSHTSLLGYSVEAPKYSISSLPWVILYWQAGQETLDYVVDIKLLNSSGQLTAGWRDRPTHGYYPLQMWHPGDVVQDPWVLFLSNRLLPDLYQLEASLVTNGQIVDQLLLGSWKVDQGVETPLSKLSLKHPVALNKYMTLLDHELSLQPSTAEGMPQLTLYWQARNQVDPPPLRIELRAEDGTTLDEQISELDTRIVGPFWQSISHHKVRVEKWTPQASTLALTLKDENGPSETVIVKNIQAHLIAQRYSALQSWFMADYTDSVRLLGYDLVARKQQEGGTLNLNLYWQALDQPSAYDIVIQLYDDQNQLLAKDVLMLPAETLASDWLKTGITHHQFQLTRASAKNYYLTVQLQNPSSGSLLPVTSSTQVQPSDQILIDDILGKALIEIE